jgi:hypothetical protein
MTETLSPTGLIVNAGVQALVGRVNEALNAQPSEPVLTYSDSDGISLTVAEAEAPKVVLENLKSGAEGVSGRLFIEIPEGEPLAAELFGDFKVGLTAFDLTLAKSAFVSTNITGSLEIPFFKSEGESPETVDFEVAIRADGSLAVTLAAQQSDTEKMTADGLVKLHYELPGDSSIDLSIATLELEREADGVWQLTLTGAFALDTVGIDWPEIQLRGLSLDSKGNVKLQGGWIELPSHTAIDFFGFHVGLQRLGLGSEVNGKGETQRWIGFDGEVNLVEGVPLGGSVRGLQVNLSTGAVSFKGVSVAFEIEDVLSFSGEIDHASFETAEEAAASGLPASFVEACEVKPGSPANVFAGGVDVNIEAAGGLEVDAQFIVAQVPFKGGGTQSCFFLALDAELPVGIPLFADVALYGLSGMFASNLRPDIGEATWWDWYKYPTLPSGLPDTTGASDLQNTEGAPDFTATDVYKWLHPDAGAFALGAGAVIGTQDDGFTASASIAFVLILPGPVVMLIGQANVLSKRVGGPGEGADFDALAVYDGEAETFELTIEAQYSIPIVIDVQATAELYVNTGEKLWFLAIGKPPHEQRVSARVLDLFETDLYFVVSQSGLVAGIWTGYKNSWSFGPLNASIDAYLAAMAAIQWSPLQLGAGVELHGEIHLEAFGIGLGITADALIEATAPDPWWVHGELSVELELPWPLPNVGGTVSLSWGGNGPPPPAPLALGSVSATLVDHGASDHYELLAHRAGAAVNAVAGAKIVVYDPPAPASPGTPGILNAVPEKFWVGSYSGVAADPSSVVPNLTPGTLGEPTTLAWAPLVPQDSHFALHFAHPVTDEAGFAGQVSPPAEVALVKLPESPVIGKDDMSNIDLQPPAVQWCINHKLLAVALYRYEEGAGAMGGWELLAASQPSGYSVQAPLRLHGAWLAPDPAAAPPTGVPKPGTVLKIAPCTVLNGKALPILPTAPGLYALKVVTLIETGRVGANNEVSQYTPMQNGEPVIEFAYLQCASGPGTASIAPPGAPSPEAPLPSGAGAPPGAPPAPNRQPPSTPLAEAYVRMTEAQEAPESEAQEVPEVPEGPLPPPKRAPSTFPRGGRLNDLATYTQWSWPGNGDAAAYYGYDLNVEFNETYVNALYATFLSSVAPYEFASPPAKPALHMRCIDRNHNHTLLNPIATHVPSAYPQSALVSRVVDLPLPEQFARAPSERLAALRLLGIVKHEAAELAAAAQAQTLWFTPLRPQTRYTLDVVAGPLDVGGERGTVATHELPSDGAAQGATLESILHASDAIGALAALEAYFARDDALTTLQRVQFTTSRYASFAEQVANVSAPSTATVRRYQRPAAGGEVPALLAAASSEASRAHASATYLATRAALAEMLNRFDPLYDVEQPTPPAPVSSGNGEQALAACRGETEQAWQAFASATASTFGQLVQALDQPAITEWANGPLPPETELSLLSADNDTRVVALLLACTEPLPWRRMWQWTTLAPTSPHAGKPTEIAILWSPDQTRALIVLLDRPVGKYALSLGFRGNVGPEVACITSGGASVSETATCPALSIAPVPRRPRPL